MATLLRSSCRLGNVIFQKGLTLQSSAVKPGCCRLIQTSQVKDNKVPSIRRDETENEYRKRLEEYFADDDRNSPKNAINYGWNVLHQKADRFLQKYMFFWFGSFTLFLFYVYTYAPDKRERDWCQREAFLELDRREKLGLPLIDENLVDPSKINLPTEEELGDFPIYV